MKILLSPETLDELQEQEYDGECADMVLNESYFAFSSEELASVKRYVEAGIPLSMAYRKVLIPLLDEEALEIYSRLQQGFGLEDIPFLNPRDYAENPYYRKVVAAMKGKKKLGDWELSMKSYRAYEPFVYDEIRKSESSPYVYYSPIAAFKEPFPYPALSQNGTTYMSLIPHEMNTMAPAIKKSRGAVVTLGLGMGYFAFMASEKDEVTSVTILERDQKVISLFKEFFLPLFNHPEKIQIIHVEDALAFKPSKKFDYAFADLHHDATDGLPLYLSLLKKEDLAEELDVWIEDAILYYALRHLVALIGEESENSDDAFFRQYDDFSSMLLCSLHFHLKNRVLKDEDLEGLLDLGEVKAILKEIKLLEA